MTDFHDELRDALGRKAAQADVGREIPEGTLRRAKRRRATTAAVTGIVTVSVLFGGFIGVRAAMNLAGGDEIRPIPGATPQVGPTGATPGPGASPDPGGAKLHCDRADGGNEDVFPDFVKVGAGGAPDSQTGELFDAVWFEFERGAGGRKTPRYFISYVDELRTDGEGTVVDVEGEAFVSVSFMARGVDLTGESPVPVYKGPTEIHPDQPGSYEWLPTMLVQEIRQTGDFEGMVSWGIGLSKKTCFYVDARPGGLEIVFPTGVVV